MANGIIVCGANGSGKTTLGRALAETLNYRHMDIEDYYFIESEIPYSKSRTRDEVCQLILNDIKQYNNFIISAVNGDMGEEINNMYKLAVYLSVPLDIRLERVKQRAYDKFGNRVLIGGDMYEQEQRFFDYVEFSSADKAGRTEIWLKTLSCPVIYLDGTKAVSENITRLLSEQKL